MSVRALSAAGVSPSDSRRYKSRCTYEKVAAVGVKFFKPRPQHASVTVYVVTFLDRTNLVYL